MPITGGGATTTTNPSWIAANLPNSAPMMAAADLRGSFARCSAGSSVRKTAPAFGALVKVAPEKPTMLTAWATPGVASAMSTMRRDAASVRASDAPEGNCVTMIR